MQVAQALVELQNWQPSIWERQETQLLDESMYPSAHSVQTVGEVQTSHPFIKVSQKAQAAL
jgi:hypothetical protein